MRDELHQRGRRGRYDAVPEKHHRHVVVGGVPPHLGEGGAYLYLRRDHGHGCRRRAGPGKVPPADDAALVRCIFESLAARYGEVLGNLRGVAPFAIERLHVIGGGAQNDLLNQLTADACGIPVVAGPSEATAIGNVMVQARALGLVGSLARMRDYIRRSVEVREFLPRTK